MLGVVHAEVATMAVEGEHCADAVLRIDLDVARLGKGEVEDLLVPAQSLLNVHEAEHQGLVSTEGPGVLVELSHQLFLALSVNYKDNSATARLEQSDHPVVSLGPQLVDLQLRHHFAFAINLQAARPKLLLDILLLDFDKIGHHIASSNDDCHSEDKTCCWDELVLRDIVAQHFAQLDHPAGDPGKDGSGVLVHQVVNHSLTAEHFIGR